MTFLKLNNDKTEFMIIQSRHSKLQYPTTKCAQLMKCPHNMGVIVDNNMCLDRQVKEICMQSIILLSKEYRQNKEAPDGKAS